MVTKPVAELRAVILGALDDDYMQDAIKDLGKAVHANVVDAVNEALEDCGYTQTCLNCNHFDEPKELCKLAGSRPPARVIAFGCPKFTEEAEEHPEQGRPGNAAMELPPRPQQVTPLGRSAPQGFAPFNNGFDDIDDDIPF